jgi:hypothetical protein
MAAGLSGVDQQSTALAAESPEPEESKPGRLYRFRFGLVYGALLGVLGAAIAGVVLLAGSDSSSQGSTAWSTWKPAGADVTTTGKEIASHVGKTYKHPTGGQLLDVLVREPAVQDVPIRAVAVQGADGTDSVAQVDRNDSLMFILCGLGPACSISKGTPSVARGQLVRREALELALYTFKYAHGVKYVITFMPPRKGEQAQYVLFYERHHLERQLSEPLNHTLSQVTPRQDTIPPTEMATINRLTDPHIFKFQLQQAQQGDAILVLTPSV